MVESEVYYDQKRRQIVEPVRPSALTLIVAIIIIIIIIGLFLLIFWISTTGDIGNVTPIIFGPNELNSVTSTPGASNNGYYANKNGNHYQDTRACTAGPTREWNTVLNITSGTCLCQIPFYGEECFLETYDNMYTALGQITDEQADYEIDLNTETHRLSFPYNTDNDSLCTAMCDADDDCIGVKWQSQGPPDFGINTTDPALSTKGKCTLLRNKVVFTPGVPLKYDLDLQANIYMKREIDPEVKDRVFIYKGPKPTRFWLADSFADGATQMNALYHATQQKIEYYPETLINSTGGMFQMVDYGQEWVGLVSENKMSGNLNDIYAIGDTSTTKIIPAGTTDLTTIIPINWSAIYMVFWDPSTDPVI